ncbi:hypothetical protein D918_01654 [Trichuris suis]|nr:hypothetical protein D918_01654 [Trichuris suis]
MMSELASLTKEVNHWKSLAEEYRVNLLAVQEELVDYQAGSHDLEAELENQLDEAETKNEKLARSNQCLRMECDRLKAIERNALLECEVDEKESLREYIQRLKDETRDLRLELHVKDRAADHQAGFTNKSTASLAHVLNGSAASANNATQSGSTMTSRIPAFNILTDFWRKNNKKSKK